MVSEVAQPAKSKEEKAFKDMHSYETKSHPVAPDAVFTGDIGAEGLPRQKAKRNADQEGDANYDKAYLMKRNEEVELDETTSSALKKAVTQTGPDGKTRTVQKKVRSDKTDADGQDKIVAAEKAETNALAKAATGGKDKIKESVKASIAKSLAKAGETSKSGKKAVSLKKAPWEKNEGALEEQTCSCCDSKIDEDGKCGCGPDCSHCGGQHDVKGEELSPKQKKIDHNKNGKIDGHDLAMLRKKKNEEVELDELSKKTLGNYIKKSAADMSSKDSLDMHKGAMKRYKGIVKATDKLAKESVELDEAPRRKGAPKMTGDSIAMQRAKDAEHNKAMGRTKTGRKKPARTMTSTQRSLASLRREEVELDEVLDTPKAMNSYRNKAKTSKDKATNSAVANILRKGDHSADLKTRAKREKGLKMADRNATKKTVKALRGDMKESVLTESIKPGSIKLNDGKSVKVSKQDADLLNRMFKDLNAKNKKEMQKVMMTDKSGFDEIVGFAREAL